MGSVPTDKLFTGQRLDQTGLYFYNARYYDPTIGRFISPDTVIQSPFNPQCFNRYSYCLNNPLTYIDPSGNEVDIEGENVNDIDAEIERAVASGDYNALWALATKGIRSDLLKAYYKIRAADSTVTHYLEDSPVLLDIRSAPIPTRTDSNGKTYESFAETGFTDANLSSTIGMTFNSRFQHTVDEYVGAMAHDMIHAVGCTLNPGLIVDPGSQFEENIANIYQRYICKKAGVALDPNAAGNTPNAWIPTQLNATFNNAPPPYNTYPAYPQLRKGTGVTSTYSYRCLIYAAQLYRFLPEQCPTGAW